MKIQESGKNRMPAEWEKHKATWLAWPHNPNDWPGKFGPVPWVWAEIVRVLHRHELVHILCHDKKVTAQAKKMCLANGVDLKMVRFHIKPNDRCWLRDSGPTAVKTARGVKWLCWRFNAWVKYDNFAQDGLVARAVAKISKLPFEEVRCPNKRTKLVLEGGGLETNGDGILILTEEWLLSKEQVRNPGMSRKDYEKVFAERLGIRETIWLGRGCAGDDTHGHIDDIARFTNPRTIVVACEESGFDRQNYETSGDNWERLLKASKHLHLELVKLPFPRPIIFKGQRVPASYANFYIANDVVIVPTFNDRNDRLALATLQELFPRREIVGIHSLDLVWGFGTLHCLTQQEPE